MTSTHELNLTRWHKVAERLTAKALEKAEQAKAAFTETRVDGYAGEAQLAQIRQRAAEAEAALAEHAQLAEAVARIRSALADANARVGVNALLSEQEALNRRSKLLREILAAQTTEMVPLDSLRHYKPFSEGKETRYFRGEGPKGAIAVQTLGAPLQASLRAEAERLQTALYATADKAADLNRETISVELSEFVAKAAGLN